MKRKAISALLCAAMTAAALCGCAPDKLITALTRDSAAESELEMRSEAALRLNSFSGVGFEALKSDEERELYAMIDLNARKLSSGRFRVFGTLTESLSDIIELYKDDNPEVFWIDDNHSYEYVDQEGYWLVNLLFSYENEELVELKHTFDTAVDAVLKEAPADGTDYEKELFVNDWLVEHCEYDVEAAEKEDVVANEQTAFGAIVDGRAVCEGYTRAFQLLCDRLSLDCVSVNGTCDAGDEAISGNHIWNAVCLDGDWYYVDVTWNDYQADDDDVKEIVNHLYFNITTEQLKKDHTISPLYGEERGGDIYCNAFVPECDSTRLYYLNYSIPELVSLKKSDNIVKALTAAAAAKEEAFPFRVSEKLDFSDTVQKLIEGEAYDWLESANKKNDKKHKLNTECKVYSYEELRIISFRLEYSK